MEFSYFSVCVRKLINGFAVFGCDKRRREFGVGDGLLY
jgi:hypothetical protein